MSIWPTAAAIGGGLIIAVVAALFFTGSNSGGATPQWRLAAVERGDVVSAVSASGTLNAVVTVEVGPVHARTWLVLGVTAQQVTCLHSFPAGSAATPAAAAGPASGFAAALAATPVGSERHEA